MNKPGLYIVSTPIGNMQDITFRAVETLQKSDIIFCEDSRVAKKLLEKHNIQTSLKVYNDNSSDKIRDYIEAEISKGKIVSLISDAGTPLISDPGYKLIRHLKSLGVNIDVIPGACAAIAALTLSGLPTDKFFFGGFLPKTTQAIEKTFEKLRDLEASLIFYESPNRITKTMQIAQKILGDRLANVGRELTKLYQESVSLPISELIIYYQNKPPKGEVVFIIEGPKKDLPIEEIEQEARALLRQGLSVRSVTDMLFEKYGEYVGRSKIYKIVQNIK